MNPAVVGEDHLVGRCGTAGNAVKLATGQNSGFKVFEVHVVGKWELETTVAGHLAIL